MTAAARAEPEQVRLWRAVIARRDALVAELARWRQPEQPVAGDHALALDDAPRVMSAHYLEELASLDRAIAMGTRERTSERGLSLGQLRSLAGGTPRSALLASARRAIEAWRRDPSDLVARERASCLLARCARTEVDLDLLVREDRALRGASSGAAERVAARIVARVTHRSV